MPLYMCNKCGCVENTATGSYWQQRGAVGDVNKFKPLCSECLTGTWHGGFKKKRAEGYVVSVEGFIYSAEEAAEAFKHLGPFKPLELPK